ncbi:MAG: hypothetical protein FWC26_09045 [Fibromonadales bacterium]|nr:hypothetical protein [Fibromonadales bacterium]
MRKCNVVMAMALLTLLGCAANKPVDAHVAKADDAKCTKLFNLGMVKADPEMVNQLKTSVEYCEFGNQIMDCNTEGYSIAKCECIEVITCNNEEYCITHTCPTYDSPIFTLK